MIDTPETDAMFFPYGRDATAAYMPRRDMLVAAFEVMERERDALKANLATQFASLTDAVLRSDARAEKAEAERDAANKKYNDARQGNVGRGTGENDEE